MSDPVTGLTLATTALTAGCDRLDQLLSRIADGDRAAFRRLYAFMAMRVWQMATAASLGSAAVTVTMATFVEVWHSAGAAARYDARDWIAAVSASRANDRLRTMKLNGRRNGHPARPDATADGRHRPPAVDDHDSHLRRELTGLLGGGPATIRTSPGVFVRIDDLDEALATIAAAGILSRPPVPGRAAARSSAIHATTARRQ